MVFTNSMYGTLRGCVASFVASGLALSLICSARLTANFMISKLFASFMGLLFKRELRDLHRSLAGNPTINNAAGA